MNLMIEWISDRMNDREMTIAIEETNGSNACLNKWMSEGMKIGFSNGWISNKTMIGRIIKSYKPIYNTTNELFYHQW